MAKLVDALGLGPSELRSWGFESLSAHQLFFSSSMSFHLLSVTLDMSGLENANRSATRGAG